MAKWNKAQWLADKQATAQSLEGKVGDFLRELTNRVDEARASAAMRAFMDIQAKFHSYSWNNSLLIFMQRPDATQVAGFHKWLELGRCVRKGEHGITIFAPCFKKVEEGGEEKSVAYFKTTTVFDVSQTDGEPLPEMPKWTSPERQAELHSRFIAYAEQVGLTVKEAELGTAQGMLSGRTITLAPAAGTKTLLHELAHYQLDHLGQHENHIIAEVEAESVAYIVGKHFGLNPEGSANYIALSGEDGKVMKACLRRIADTAKTMIEAIEGHHD